MSEQNKPDPVEAFQALAKSIGEANKKVQELLARRKVVIKGADIKPDVYGGYLQKKKRRHKK